MTSDGKRVKSFEFSLDNNLNKLSAKDRELYYNYHDAWTQHDHDKFAGFAHFHVL